MVPITLVKGTNMALNIRSVSSWAVKQIANHQRISGSGGDRSERASGPDCTGDSLAARLLAIGHKTASRSERKQSASTTMLCCMTSEGCRRDRRHVGDHRDSARRGRRAAPSRSPTPVSGCLLTQLPGMRDSLTFQRDRCSRADELIEEAEFVVRPVTSARPAWPGRLFADFGEQPALRAQISATAVLCAAIDREPLLWKGNDFGHTGGVKGTGSAVIDVSLARRCEAHGYDFFRSDDPVAAAGFVVSAGGVGWAWTWERHGVPGVCQRQLRHS